MAPSFEMRKKRNNPGQFKRRYRFRPHTWLMRHAQVALSSLGRLSRSPLSTLMTVAVIGIALALPAGLYVVLTNIQTLSGSWEGAATISLFLNHEITEERAENLALKLGKRDDIAEIRVIERQQALEEFRRLSGFGHALDALDENPLPAVLVIRPTEQHSSPKAAERLVQALNQLPETDFANLDMQWVRRFHAIAEIAQRGVLVITSLFGLAVLLIVGNTIRLEIQNRHAEIEITKLIGATNAFIRRPFLYTGLWYGLLGGITAWLLVSLSLWLLGGPVDRLAGLYQSGFGLSGTGFDTVLALLGGSTLLGFLGSWLAVGRHLSAIEPS